MSWLDKLKEKQKNLKEQYKRGKKVTRDMKLERQQKRLEKLEGMPDGTWKRMRFALRNDTKILDFLHDELEVRKRIRDEKYKEE